MSESTMNEEVEIYYYRKDHINQNDGEVDLLYGRTKKELLAIALVKAKAEDKEYVVFEKESTPPDFWLILKNLYRQQNQQKPPTLDEIIERLRGIQSEAESLKDAIDDLLDER